MKWVKEIQAIIDHFQRRGLKVVSEHSECKYETMKFATRQKLIQNRGLLEELISCEGNIVYYSRYSSYWGRKQECVYNSGSPNAWYDWTGLNQYGKILMELRCELTM